jgi:hypothetical protein
MEHCIICKKEISGRRGDVCGTCKNFFKWKYGKKSEKIIDTFRELNKPFKRTIRRSK